MPRILYFITSFKSILIRLVSFFILTTLPSGILQAQGNANSPYIPAIIPPSPNAAALMKFVDVPVSFYTGTADINVPIYTIQAKGISVPVSLSYHTGGIKLKEEASSVGLGWALNAGGMISRSIMDQDDFGTGNIYFTGQCPQFQGDISYSQNSNIINPPNISPFFFDFYCNYRVNTSTGTEDFTPAFQLGSYDMEPDIFSYNFLGHSGRFILTRAGKVVMEKQENIRIQFQGTGSNVTFTITDDHGNTFYFNVLELAAVSPKPSEISSWLLSKIVTQQRDSIMFTYMNGGSTASSVPDTYQTYADYCVAVNGLTTTTAIIPYYSNQTLQSIDFNNGHLQFAFDANRSDLDGSYKLDSVMIYSKTAAGTQTYVKQDNLYYSYFNSTYHPTPEEYYRLKLDSVKEKSGRLSLPPYSFVYNNPNPGAGSDKHSYNIDHWGYYNGASNITLIPSMDIEFNPPTATQFDGIPAFLQYSGGNRQSSFPSMQTFSLQQVTYPTGGKTALAYQPNDYDYGNSLNGATDPLQFVQLISMDSLITSTRHGLVSGSIDLTNIYPPPLQLGKPMNNVTINVSFRYQQNNNFVYSHPAGKIYFTLAGLNWDISGATCNPTGPVCTASLSTGLNPGVYNWSAYIDPSIDTATVFAGIYVSVQYQETQQVYNVLQQNNYISPASGLRIQSVTNYKDANTIATQKVYNYSYLEDKLGTGHPQQYSYGRLMSLPSYARYGITSTSQGGDCTAMFLFGSSINSLTSAIGGNIVGYDNVAEFSVDPQTGLDIGKTVYSYYNSADTAIPFGGYRMPGTQNIGNNLNGLLLSKITYSDSGGVYTKTDESDYYYHTTNRAIYYSPKYEVMSGTPHPTYCSNDSSVGNEVLAEFYPSIKSEKVLLDSTHNIVYQQGDTTKAVVTSTQNSYDNPAHYQITRTRIIDSKGNLLITHIKYPQDYLSAGSSYTGNTVIDTMLRRNMVAETIEKQDTIVYSGSPTSYVRGAELSLYRILTTNANTLVPDKVYNLDLQAPVTNFQPFSFSGNTLSMDSRYRQMVSFDQYDLYNNIQQYTATNQNPVAIIWDYTNTYPIAQVKNALLPDVAASSFEADGKGGWSFTGTPVTDVSSPTGSKCYNMASGNITKSGLTATIQYVFSFWAKTGASVSLTGGTYTGKTGKTINGWTLYEDIVSGATSITLAGTGYVDEMRLYPVTAQMTTYTYSSLLGMTTACDADNRITYYFYDQLGRLKWVKDQDGNILKTYQYHYQNLTTQY